MSEGKLTSTTSSKKNKRRQIKHLKVRWLSKSGATVNMLKKRRRPMITPTRKNMQASKDNKKNKKNSREKSNANQSSPDGLN